MTPTPYNTYIPLLPEPTSPTMDFLAPEFKEPISTPPKLLLFSLPSKPPKLPDGVTPPPNNVATVPFLWEEAPGKPRLATIEDVPKSKIVRSLDLPPRLTTTIVASPINNGNNHCDKLVNNVGIDVIPSPTTVLSGPYEGVHVSKSLLPSPEKVVVSSISSKNKGKSRMPLKKLMRKDRSSGKFSSWRWGSFRDISGGIGDRSSSLKFCSWRWDSCKDIGGGDDSVSGGKGGDIGGSLCSSFDDFKKSIDSGEKIGKVTRKSSFTFGNATTSGFLASMYGTLKQVMPWKSRR